MGGLLGLKPGTLFADTYEVRRVLARGGMGSVYVAVELGTEREVALKVLLPELVSDERMRQRFTREVRVAADIDSPYVPRVYGSGIAEDGTPYLAMELLKGRDLRQFVEERGALSIAEAGAILEQVGHALAAAHRMGLVHRDLKAENVFLHESGHGTEVKLLDFGVVKVLDQHKTSATGTGAVGSPLWMAPEQTSAGGRIAPATDVWALGLLAFYLLTGTFYWKAASDDSGVAGLLREMHIDPIAPPSRRAVELELETRFPPGFDAWFLRALERDSTARFLDGGAAWASLAPILGAEGHAAFAETVSIDRTGDLDVRPGPRFTGGPVPSTDTWIDHGAEHGTSVDAGTQRGVGQPTPPPGRQEALAPSPFAHSHRNEPSSVEAHPPTGPARLPATPSAAPLSAPTPAGTPASGWGPPPASWSAEAQARASTEGSPAAFSAWHSGPGQAVLPPAVAAPLPSTPPAASTPAPSHPGAPSVWGAPVSPGRPLPPVAAPPAKRGCGATLLWVVGFLVAGLAASVLSGVIVWIVLSLLEPGPRERSRPRPAPTTTTVPTPTTPTTPPLAPTAPTAPPMQPMVPAG